MTNKNKFNKQPSTHHQESRRAFIKNSAALTALAAASPMLAFPNPDALAKKLPAENMMHGIQVGAVSFVDEGVENVLEILQNRAAVNTLFLTTFTYGRGLAGRQIPGHPFPDHGSQQSDEKTFH